MNVNNILVLLLSADTVGSIVNDTITGINIETRNNFTCSETRTVENLSIFNVSIGFNFSAGMTFQVVIHGVSRGYSLANLRPHIIIATANTAVYKAFERA